MKLREGLSAKILITKRLDLTILPNWLHIVPEGERLQHCEKDPNHDLQDKLQCQHISFSHEHKRIIMSTH